MPKSSTEPQTDPQPGISGAHLLVRGEIVTLSRRHPMVLGRAPNKADIVLPSSHVSSAHARIAWQDDKFIIEDLGSLNGTWVGDERIASPKLLTSGDRIRIRPFIILFSNPAPMRSGHSGSFEGDLSVLALADLIQMLNSAGQTGVLHLETEGVGHPGFELMIKDGALVAASGGGCLAENAFYESLRLKSGHFRFSAGEVRTMPGGEITQSTMTLLLEGFQRIDEGGDLKTKPDNNAENPLNTNRAFATQKLIIPGR